VSSLCDDKMQISLKLLGQETLRLNEGKAKDLLLADLLCTYKLLMTITLIHNILQEPTPNIRHACEKIVNPERVNRSRVTHTRSSQRHEGLTNKDRYSCLHEEVHALLTP